MSNQSVPDAQETLARLWEEHTRHEFRPRARRTRSLQWSRTRTWITYSC